MLLLKVSTDKKTGELIQTFKRAGGGRLRVFGGLGLTTLQMLTLGERGVALIKERVARGIGSDDAPMKPLSIWQRSRWSKKQGRYVKYGEPIHPEKPHRNLWGPGADGNGPLAKGHMLDKLSVRSVSDKEVRIDITSQWARTKARVNELRSPWFGWSTNDLKQLVAQAQAIFDEKVADIGALLRMPKGAKMRPIWMNPFAHHYSAGSTDVRWATQLARRIASGESLNKRRTS